MTLFAHCFLFVFCQLAVGGLLALAVPPFHDIARGFYKSSAGVFLFCGFVGGGGSIYLSATRGTTEVSIVEAVSWGSFLLLFSGYLATLWGEAESTRARLFAGALAVGLLALALTGAAVAAHTPVPLTIADAWAGAAALGSVTSGMLIGHWYLIDPGMEIEPFRRCFRFFVGSILAELALVVVSLAWGVLAGESAVPPNASLAILRVLLGPIAALGIALLIGRVLAIPQTMAATGLFYIATLAVLVGSFLGRYFTFRTGLAL